VIFSKYKKALWTVSVLVIAGGYLSLRYAFWEPSNVQPSSIAYTLKIPAYAKTFPVWQARSAPLYGYRIADGEKPHVTRIRYTSKSSCLSLLPNIKHLDASCETSQEGHFLCQKTNARSGDFDMVLLTIETGCKIDISIF